MYKIMLMLVLIISCGAMGFIKSGICTKRLHELNNLRSTLHILITEINYRNEPLSLIFQRFKDQNNSIANEIFSCCYDYLQDGISLSDSWNYSVDIVCKDSCLSKEDIKIIRDLGNYLGQSSAYEQTNFIRLVDEKLKQQITSAKEENDTKGKMYRGLGFSTGIAIAVLLI